MNLWTLDVTRAGENLTQKTGWQQKSRDTKRKTAREPIQSTERSGENLWRGRLSTTAKTGAREQLRIDTGYVVKTESRKNPTGPCSRSENRTGKSHADRLPLLNYTWLFLNLWDKNGIRKMEYRIRNGFIIFWPFWPRKFPFFYPVYRPVVFEPSSPPTSAAGPINTPHHCSIQP
jgi:hypothetical protein